MSTPGDTMMSVGDIMSTPGGVQYTGDTLNTLGDTMMSECGGYHEYTRDVQHTGVSIQIQLFSQ